MITISNVKVAFIVLSVFFSSTSSAATWHGMAVGTDDLAYFFDSESVQKSPNTVSVWVKTVSFTKPKDADGVWATAFRYRFDCLARTIQMLTYSDYDENGKYISSSDREGSTKLVTPDSTGEGMLNIFCESSFPNDKSEEKYWKIIENDVFKARDAILRSMIDAAPK